MSTAARRAAVLPTPVLVALGAPPLLAAVALGLAVHHHRTRRTTLR